MKIPEEAFVVPRIQCVIPETRWVLLRPRCHEGERRGESIVGHRDRIRIRDTPTPSGCRVYVTHPAARTCTISSRNRASTRRCSDYYSLFECRAFIPTGLCVYMILGKILDACAKVLKSFYQSFSGILLIYQIYQVLQTLLISRSNFHRTTFSIRVAFLSEILITKLKIFLSCLILLQPYAV